MSHSQETGIDWVAASEQGQADGVRPRRAGYREQRSAPPASARFLRNRVISDSRLVVRDRPEVVQHDGGSDEERRQRPGRDDGVRAEDYEDAADEEQSAAPVDRRHRCREPLCLRVGGRCPAFFTVVQMNASTPPNRSRPAGRRPPAATNAISRSPRRRSGRRCRLGVFEADGALLEVRFVRLWVDPG